MHASPPRAQRTRRLAAAAAALFLLETLLPLALFTAGAPAAAAVIRTTDDGRAQFLAPVSGVPYRFNISVPHGALVTSFTLAVSTPPGQAPPDVPANVSLDLGLDGADWAFGGGAEGALGFQQRFADSSYTSRAVIGNGPAAASFVLPRGANVSALRFLATPRVNMSLWNASEFVTVVSGSAAVPLNLTGNAAPAFGDLGRDGRTDLLATGADGNLHLYTQVGSLGLLFEDNTSVLPGGLQKGRQLMDPALIDLDRDGDLDIVSGSAASGLLAFIANNSTVAPPFDFAEDVAYFSGIPAYTNASPALGDLDGDGDPDLVVGAADGSLTHYRNEIGEGTGVRWRVQNTFLAPGLAVPADASPALVDLDGDGDLDLVAGAQDGSFTLFENRGNLTAPSFVKAGTFLGLLPGARSTPALTDWSGDGRPDLFYGTRSGLVYYSRALGGLPADVEVQVSGGQGAFLVAPGELSAATPVTVPPSQLAAIETASLPLSADGWGNALETVSLGLNASHFGEVELSALAVEYNATLPVRDLADAYRSFAAGAIPVGDQTVVPMQLQGAPLLPARAPNALIGELAVRIDDAPAFLPFPALALDEDTAAPQLLDLATVLADEDPDNATFSVVSWTNASYVQLAVGGNRYLSVDAASGEVNNNWTGTVEAVLRAVDARGQAATSPPVTVTVRNVEDAPVLEYIAAQTLGPNDALRLSARAIDGDAGAVIRYSLFPPSPSSMSIDAVTGLITWNPSSADRMGSAHVVVAVTDGILTDTQAFEVYFLPTQPPVFGRQLPLMKVLPGRPEFLNIFDFASGDASSVRSVTLEGPPHPYVNLSAGGEWLAFDYPADFTPGSDRVTLSVATRAGNESLSVDVTILPSPTGLYLAPFPPTPLSRAVPHRIELLRYAARIQDFRNLSFEVGHPFASITGFNLTLFVPGDYPGSSLVLPLTVRAGNESASTTWTVQLESGAAAPRIGRLALIAAGARDVDLGYVLAPLALEPARLPLSTDSPHFTPVGVTSFRIAFPPWPADVRAREYWPIERARVTDSRGALVLEVEIGFDGRSRYIDRVQYFQEDDESVIDGSFANDERLVGAFVHNISLAATGPFKAGPLEPIVKLDGSAGVGWRMSFTKDTRLEQLTLVALTDPSGANGGSLSFGVWAVVAPRDDAPTYRGGLADIVVQPGFNVTIDLSLYFADEEGDDLLFALSVHEAGVSVDRASGWLTVDGRSEVNLTGVRVVASESKNQALAATSEAISIRVEASAGPPPASPPAASSDLWSGWTMPLLVLGALAAVGAAAFAVLWRRLDEEEETADQAVDSVVGALGSGEQWEAVRLERPPPTAPPAADDPQMLALEEEWSRVIASRQTEAASAPGDMDAEIDTGRRAPKPPPQDPAPPARPPSMTSSDTETERRAGETEPDLEVKRRRIAKR